HPRNVRAGSDQRHVALDDIDELRNFIETGFPQYFPDRCNSGIAPHRLFHAAGVASIRAHRTEFINFENPVSIPVSVLKKQHWPWRRDLDRDGDRYQERCEEEQCRTRNGNIEKSLS